MKAKNMTDGNQYTHLHEVPVEESVVYSGNFLTLRRDLVKLPDGKEATREFVNHPGAVVILPLFDDGTVLLERQFRYAIRQVVIEFPAGKIDPGEDSLACAMRELHEETGYTARDWSFLCTIHNALGYSDEHLDFYLARGLSEGERQLADGEFIETFRMPLADLLAWVRQGKITDAKTVIGAFWLETSLAEA